MMPSLARMNRNVELLLTPELVLDILRSYTLYSTLAVGDLTRTIKVIPRYQQVEAVEAIVGRALDPKRKKGLLIARKKRAEAQKAIQETLGGLKSTSAFESFFEIASRIARAF